MNSINAYHFFILLIVVAVVGAINGCNGTRPKVWSSIPQGATGGAEGVRMFAGKM